MARRCGCSGTCSCLLVAGEGIVVEGIGSIENPYQISSDAADLIERIEFEDSQTIDFTASGIGSGANPMTVSAVARVATSELTDVQGVPDSNDVLVWVIDHWEPQPMPVALPPGGTTGQVMTKVDDTDGNVAWSDVPDELPPGGAVGQVLTKQTAADGSVYWATPASGGGGGGPMVPSEPYYAASRRHAGGLALAAGTIVGIPFDTEDYTEGITWNGTGFVIPVAGYYHVNASVRISTAGTGHDPIARIRVNGSSAVAGMNVQGSVASVGVTSTIVRTLKLNQGDVVDIAVSSTLANSLVTPQAYYTWVNITKVPSPGGVPTAEPIYASRRGISANVSIPNNVETPLVLDQLVTDDGIPWATSGWIIPVTGWYQINALVGWIANATGVRQVKITQNGASTTYMNATPATGSTSGSTWSRALKCTAGDIINVSVLQNSGAALNTNQVTVDIHKIPQTIPASNGIVGERIYSSSRGQATGYSLASGSAHTVMPFEFEFKTDGIPWDATQNGYIIPVSGWYSVKGAMQFGSAAAGYRIISFGLNGSQFAAASDVPAAANGGQTIVLTRERWFDAGDLVQLRAAQTSGVALTFANSGSYCYFDITKVPSVFPQSVALGERNYHAYRAHATATSIPNITSTVIPFDTAINDDGITWDGTGFVCPVAGYYSVEGVITYAASNTTGGRNALIYVNNTQHASAAVAPVTSGIVSVPFASTVKCAAGDVIKIQGYQSSGGAVTISPSGVYNRVSITKVPAPAVAGSAASGLWGTAPLDLYGSNDLVGKAVYVDSRGQLRAQPTAVVTNTKPATDPPSSYPLGWSSMDLDNTFSQANGWTQSSMVETVRRNGVGNTTAVQWQYYTNGNIVKFRSSAAGDTWGPWVDVIGVGSNKKMASGRTSISLNNTASGTAAITFPAGLFAAAPRFLISGVGSAVMFWASSNSPSASGVSVSCRQLDGVAVTATYSADWIAVEDG